MDRFTDKTALVTGGGSGIGKAIAERLAAEGARVLTAQRRADPAFEAIEADLSDPTVPEQLVAEVIARTGRLDVLVNSAGIMLEADSETMPWEDWQKTLAINLTAPFLTIRAALPHLRASQGSIVNIGSIEGLAANPRHVAYCASKAGLHGLTRAIAVDFGQRGIRCNAVAPGWIETDLNSQMVAIDDTGGFNRRLDDLHPLRRVGAPDDVASLVAYLASTDAAFITGQVYTVDGGRMTQLSLP